MAKDGERAGWVGLIASNSFMKRESGVLLVERFFPTKDLRLLVDSEGAWIPGHNMEGTPTVIIVGINRVPSTGIVRSVLGKGIRENRSHGVEGKGPYWSAIVDHVQDPGFDNDWISVVDLDRALLGRHPWSLVGGGTGDLLEILDGHSRQLGDYVLRAGFYGVMGLDDAMTWPYHIFARFSIEKEYIQRVVVGDEVRNWGLQEGDVAFHPYDAGRSLVEIDQMPKLGRWMWPYRTCLGNRATFAQGTYFRDGRPWWQWHQLPKDSTAHKLAIAYAEVATHNHFVIDRERRAFGQTAPVIKLRRTANEDDHLALLGILNSSAACFWLRSKTKPKGGASDQLWLRTFQFNASNVKGLPLPSSLPMNRARDLDGLAQLLAELEPRAVTRTGVPSRSRLDDARLRWTTARARMIALQEELDWEVYGLYGLVDGDLSFGTDALPCIAPGERAFEISLLAKSEEAAWFVQPGYSPTTKIPNEWPAEYRDIVGRRIALIESHCFIGLLERPEYKRRWESDSWEEQEEQALRAWLLDRLEDKHFWFDRAGRPSPRSIMHLADDVARDPDLASVLALWEGRPDVSVVASLRKLLADEAVPYLAAYRYKDTGLRNREAWEHTWDLQRREDAGEKVDMITVPPSYTSADFTRKEYWAHRGKLDVPKERFILYPDAGRTTDPTPVIGWAGWDHAQQALAIDQLLQQGESDGWADERLIPLVAGLAELLPWVRQWYAESDPFYGGASPAEFFVEQLDDRTRQVERTVEQLRAWRPAPARRGRARKAATS